jgi:hypothetical protein
MDPKSLAKWSMALGMLGILAYLVAFVLLWQGGNTILGERLDHKDLYFAGTGLLYIAIWMKLGAIFLK